MTGPLKTYSHLQAARRMPSEYEIVTSALHYYVARGFEVDVPLAAWYERYQKGSPLRVADWDGFRDPRETTYTKYTALQKDREAHVDAVLRSIEETGYDAKLPGPWLERLAGIVSPARYLWHGLQMAAAYVGQMAPGGRITVAAALQAADEMRRVQRFAYRLAQLCVVRAGLADDGRRVWLEHPAWQPLRRLTEELLTTYDWGEAMTALNLCVKPVLDDLFLVQFGELAGTRGDYLFGQLCFSLAEDCAWHREWSQALFTFALAEGRENRAVVEGWVERWLPKADDAASALACALDAPRAAAASSERARSWLRAWGLRS